MPQAYVKKVASKIGISKDHAENIWKKAKMLARKHAGTRSFYAYTTKIFQSMTHQAGRKAKKESDLVMNPRLLVEDYISGCSRVVVGKSASNEWNDREKLFTYQIPKIYNPIEAEDKLRGLGITFTDRKDVAIGCHAYVTGQGIMVAYYDDLKGVLFIHKDIQEIQPLAQLNTKFPLGTIHTGDAYFKKY